MEESMTNFALRMNITTHLSHQRLGRLLGLAEDEAGNLFGQFHPTTVIGQTCLFPTPKTVSQQHRKFNMGMGPNSDSIRHHRQQSTRETTVFFV